MAPKRGRSAAKNPEKDILVQNELDLSSDEEEDFSEDDESLDEEEGDLLEESGEDDSDDERAPSEKSLSKSELRSLIGARRVSGASTEPVSDADSDGTEEEEEDDDDDDDDGTRPKKERSLPPVPYSNVASESDSEEDDNRNTIGDVPLEWYKHEDHIGYDRDGNKLGKKGGRDMLDSLIARSEGGKNWRTIYDPYNDEEITLSSEEVRMLMRIQQGRFPHVEVNPFEEYDDWFTRDQIEGPLVDRPIPKRRFLPSKHEEKKIVKLVRAIRRGWIKVGENNKDKKDEEPEVYMLWGDDGNVSSRTVNGLTYIPPPKAKLPGHQHSYRPPAEYIPTEEEKAGWDLLPPEDRPTFEPQAHDSLRLVPAYPALIQERFERCLDLYLCPRVQRKRHFVDPKTLLPKLPKPRDLEPYPKALCIRYLGHNAPIRSVACDGTGQYLISGSDDHSVKLWEVRTGRCLRSWDLGEAVDQVAWCPNPSLRLISAAVGKTVYIWWSGLGGKTVKDAALEAFASVPNSADADEEETEGIEDQEEEEEEEEEAGRKNGKKNKKKGHNHIEEGEEEEEDEEEEEGEDEDEANGGEDGSTKRKIRLCRWEKHPRLGDGVGIRLRHNFAVDRISWHGKGDYMVSVCPRGMTRAVLVHHLPRHKTQNPFRKNKGRLVDVLFHPTKPFLFVGTENSVRIYNLATQALTKKLLSGSGQVTSMAVHPSGDHIVLGSSDSKVRWFDLDLSNKPYRSLRYHELPVTAISFHPRHPLFASTSDDGTCHVFHGMVYNDLMKNPLIVPVKILRSHQIKGFEGVQALCFHPFQPWVFTAGADGEVILFCE